MSFSISLNIPTNTLLFMLTTLGKFYMAFCFLLFSFFKLSHSSFKLWWKQWKNCETCYDLLTSVTINPYRLPFYSDWWTCNYRIAPSITSTLKYSPVISWKSSVSLCFDIYFLQLLPFSCGRSLTDQNSIVLLFWWEQESCGLLSCEHIVCKISCE